MSGIRIDVYHHFAADNSVIAAITELKELIVMNQAQLEAALVQVKTDLTEASTELVAKIAALEAAVAAAGNSTPAVDAALADVSALAAGLAGIVPNA
jgi:hypothetical protein